MAVKPDRMTLRVRRQVHALRRRLFNLSFRTTDFGGTRRNLRGEPPRSFGRHATREVREARFRRQRTPSQKMLDLSASADRGQIFGKHTAIAPRLSGRCRLTKSRPMMSSYKWCVEPASTFRYPARAHSGVPQPAYLQQPAIASPQIWGLTSGTYPLQAIAMSIADAQAAAAAAASGENGEMVGNENDDSHKRRRTEVDGASPMEHDASLEAAIAASLADAGGQNPFDALFTTAPPASSAPQIQTQPPSQPSQQQGGLSAAYLAQAFASIGQPSAPPAQHQPPRRRGSESRETREGSGVPVQAIPSTPAACEWWREVGKETDASPLEFADPTSALAALSSILAAPVAAAGVTPPADLPAGQPLQTMFTRGTALSDKILDAVIKSRFMAGRLRRRALRRAGWMPLEGSRRG